MMIYEKMENYKKYVNKELFSLYIPNIGSKNCFRV